MASIFIVRGDLRSQTGYSKALRALIAELRDHFDQILGVDLHFSITKSVEAFPHHILTDGEVDEMTTRMAGDRFTVLHFTTPDHFRPIRNAYNVGYFFWETDRFRPEFFWEHNIRLMDAMWLPNEFMVHVVRKAGFDGPCKVLPWPHDFDVELEQEAKPLPLSIECVVRRASGATALVKEEFEAVRRRSEKLYLSISTDVPRKGLPILIGEWLEYLQVRQKKSFLLVKVSSVDVTKSREALGEELLTIVNRFLNVTNEDVDIGFLFGTLTETEINQLYRTADAYVTTTLGEGFGGPIVECLQQRQPFISPRHTSLEELISPDYSYILETVPAPLDLGTFLPVYSPSSTWHVAVKGSLVQRLQEMDSANGSELDQVINAARVHAAAFCGTARVAVLVAGACEEAKNLLDEKWRGSPSAPSSLSQYPRGIQPAR